MAQKESRTLLLFAFFIFLAIAVIGVIIILRNDPMISLMANNSTTLTSSFVDRLMK